MEQRKNPFFRAGFFFSETTFKLLRLFELSISGCFKEQRYKIFESNSQQVGKDFRHGRVVSKSKDTRFLKAIHNSHIPNAVKIDVVSKSKDTRFLKAIHNPSSVSATYSVVVSKSKDTRFLKAIHNDSPS